MPSLPVATGSTVVVPLRACSSLGCTQTNRAQINARILQPVATRHARIETRKLSNLQHQVARRFQVAAMWKDCASAKMRTCEPSQVATVQSRVILAQAVNQNALHAHWIARSV